MGVVRSVAVGLTLAGLFSTPAVSSDWSGFYVGGGVSFKQTGVAFPTGTNSVRIDDVDTPGLDFQASPPLDFEGTTIGGHVLSGYLFQTGRFVYGVEGDLEFGEGFSVDRTPGVPACVNPPIVTPGNFSCIGPQVFFSKVETQGHLRGVLGVELTPSMMGFVAGGMAVGKSPERIGAGIGGFLAVPPSSPILGAATVTRSGIRETVYGFSIGGGVQVRAGSRLRLRAEYLYDRYPTADIAVGGAGFGGTVGDITVNSFVGPGREIDIDSHTIRLSAIYQFSPTDGEAQKPDYAVDSDWSGFYLGGGLSLHRTNVDFPNATNFVRIDDTDTPGIDFSATPPVNAELDSVGGHVLGGYMWQKNRLVFGLEGDYEFGNSASVERGPGGPACANPPIVTPGNFSCIGTKVFFSDVETMGHVRAVAGFELTPALLGFVAGGLAIGKSPDVIGARVNGYVANPPSSPLLGAATVTRSGISETVLGYSIGGGVQVKVTRNFRLRAEYLYDGYEGVDIAVGGAGFGGTIEDTQTSSFVSPGNEVRMSNHAVRISAIFQF